MPDFSSVIDLTGVVLAHAWAQAWTQLVALTLIPGKISLASLAAAGCVAILFLGARRKDVRRSLKLKVLMRALFPRKLMRSRSVRADIWYSLINIFLLGSFFGFVVLTYGFVSHAVTDALIGLFGVRQSAFSDFTSGCILTLALFLAFELGYWLDHYLSHNIPFLWEFHKTHHSAEVLTPLTNFRMHPIDAFKFANIIALSQGVAGGAVIYLLGHQAEQFTFGDTNALTLVLAYLLVHLQHSHIWIAFTGVWGRLLLSPAHHQLHHSTDPAHFNKNLGSFIGVWDWAFGTLCIPTRKRQKLNFGVDPVAETRHTMWEGFVTPFALAWRTLKMPQPIQEFLDEGEDGALSRPPEPARMMSAKVAE